MVSKPLKKRSYLVPAGVFTSLLFSLYLMSHATQSASQFNDSFSSLILLNVLGTIFLFVVLIGNIRWLWRQFKKQAVGSRITLRVVALFLTVSLVPTGIVFYFSSQLLHQSVESWFDVQIDEAMQNSLTLSQRSFDNRKRLLMRDTRVLANALSNESDMFLSLTLDTLREKADAVELTTFSKQGQIIATTNVNPNVLIPNTPSNEVFLLAKQNGEFINIEPIADKALIVRVIVKIKHSNPPRYLQAVHSIPSDLTKLALSVEDAYSAYQELNYLRNSLKFSFTLTLSLVLVFSLLAASWAAFVFARQLVAPIRQLVQGTQSVAKGDYEKRLTVGRQDELGFLVNSFNAMTLRISNARMEAANAQRDAENQHAYLETVLSHLSNGVLGFDHSLNLKTTNWGADEILEHSLGRCLGSPLNTIHLTFPKLGDFTRHLSDRFSGSTKEWQSDWQLDINHQKKTLLLQGAPLYAADNKISGYVLIFDDITSIIQSQRNAAWGEVAQRLAHEIKNPLTPIQLSAERLQRKLHVQLDDEANKVLKKSTDTIVQQVSALKSMVNDFSDFARPIQSKRQTIAVDQLIENVASLYQGQIKQLTVSVEKDLPLLFADPVRLRQVLINLIKNAQEAIANNKHGQIDLSAVYHKDSDSIEICIADTGPGVDNSSIDTIFEPYVTSKDKGTGLGLAIVKKIIQEHGGTIFIKPVEPHGAQFVIQLPLIASEQF